LFWRSFLLRFITNEKNSKPSTSIRFSWGAFAAVAGAFYLLRRWLAALYARLRMGYCGELSSIFACIVAHGVTNLPLGLYIAR